MAAAALARGELVAFPTETVYGLGADAASETAVARVYRLKNRPGDHPLIVHVLDARQGAWWAQWTPRAQRLADAFWPGPLTMILRRRAQAPGYACAGQATIGLRAPAHPVARALLVEFARLGGHGVAAPSANRFGRVSPTRARHVLDDLGAEAPLVLDGGACDVGVESTIVDLSRERAVLLRPGGIETAALESILGEAVLDRDAQAPRAPGTLHAHYAPVTPIELVEREAIEPRLAHCAARGERVAVWARAPLPTGAALAREMPADSASAARVLYDALRELDRAGCDRMLIERVPHSSRWRAVADRLARAEAGSRR